MVMYLRDKGNETLLDVDCYVKTEGDCKFVELGSTVCIGPYSKLLLQIPEEEREHFIALFDFLQELRGWLWESHFATKKNTADEYDDVIETLRGILKGAATLFDLGYVED